MNAQQFGKALLSLLRNLLPKHSGSVPSSHICKCGCALMELLEQFKIAWLRGTPFIAIRTPDQFATQSLILKSINGRKSPLMSWDISRGLRPVNDYGKAALEEMGLVTVPTAAVIERVTGAPARTMSLSR